MEPPARFNFVRDVVERQDPARLALRFCNREGMVEDLTFGQVGDRAARWAGVLRSCGVAPGDRVLVLIGRTPEWHAVMLAALKVGAVAIPCSEMLRAKDLDFRVRHSGAGLLVADPGSRAEVAAMAESPQVVHVGEAELGEPDTATADTAAGDSAFILYTSGTTKDPKGVVHTHRYTWAKRAQAERWLDAKPEDLVWCTAGTGWAKSIWNVLLGPWSCGSAVILHEGGFDPDERFRLIGSLGATVLCQAPTEYRLMAKLDALDRHDVSGVRHMVSAGEPLNPEVIRAFEVVFGRTIHDGYGQTENTLLVGNFPGAEIRPGSMGLTRARLRRAGDRLRRGRRLRSARRATSPCAATRRRCSPATGMRPRRRPPSTAASGTSPATGRCATRTATSGSPDAPTTSSSRPPIGSGRSRWRARCSSTLRSQRALLSESPIPIAVRSSRRSWCCDRATTAAMRWRSSSRSTASV